MPSTFLLEIGTEELPAEFVGSALDQLKKTVVSDLAQLRLVHGEVTVTGTPRRLVIRVESLIDRQSDLEEERKGPPVKQAMVDGQPGPAALGFAKRCGVDPLELKSRDTPKGRCLFALVRTLGEDTTTLLTNRIPAWIDDLQGKRFMRWGDGDQRFSRPIRWLVSLYGSEVVSVTLSAAQPPVNSGRLSRAHRLLQSTLEIDHADSYFKSVESAGVMVDRLQRERLIRSSLNDQAAASSATVDCPEELFQELVDLVEAPRVLSGEISDCYLDLPPEVIVTVMQAHQRYVPLRRSHTRADPLALQARDVLLSKFLLVSNGLASADAKVVRGNERVLSARLADAEFFLTVDRKCPSDQRREALNRVTFAKDLGSLRDRSDRISWLIDYLIQSLPIPSDTATHAQRAAYFCKHDLVSQMVGEFPELQGVMGAKYLLEEGEDRQVALAVAEHYQPRGSGDSLPSSAAGALLALADRLELLLSIYAKGDRPSGSSDPYALRRAGNGIVQILWDRGWRLPLQTLLCDAARHWSELFLAFDVDVDQLVADLSLLLRQRMVSQFEEDGFPADLVQSVAGESIGDVRILGDPVDGRERLELLNQLRRDRRLEGVKAVVQRAAKLAEKGDLKMDQLTPVGVVQSELFQSVSEVSLLKELELLAPLSQSCNYVELADGLQSAAKALEVFFDGPQSVMVMADDLDVRRNRLNLLGVLRNQASVLACFDCIQS